ncbi:hypothetical protein CEXT_584511 [Caerostris extrusa]|uniref:Uncharacterized protein n=1 Tax=Caerostris extrusa TaxID=172846 RepID=A0AAV4U747_CAEEX|nr:hypothetical protein CEXT_584511 [Caerostris extrusa]
MRVFLPYHPSNCNKIHCCWGCWAYDCNYESSPTVSPLPSKLILHEQISNWACYKRVRFIRVEEHFCPLLLTPCSYQEGGRGNITECSTESSVDFHLKFPDTEQTIRHTIPQCQTEPLPTTSAYERFEQQSHCPLFESDFFYPIFYQIATKFTVVGATGI